ncbi:hypothetical protein GCM10025780_26870 [Frondihabitans cladoniiphilus]|uniref:Uncharacterized protein n=1 Tax=Frondihabitans cladoniiphilus TaxID=715785 RepID=A0ABP8W4A0_9MICO
MSLTKHHCSAWPRPARKYRTLSFAATTGAERGSRARRTLRPADATTGGRYGRRIDPVTAATDPVAG